jgi:isomerase DpgB
VSALSALTDVYLAVDGGAPLSRSLIASVTGACARIEEGEGKDLTLLVHIDGSNPGAAEPWPHETEIHLVNQWERALRRLERLPALVLTVAGGACRGPAFEVLLATDYRVAAPDLTLETVPVAGSSWPGMGLYRIANQLGVAAARRMLVLGSTLSATQAAHVGLVDEVAEDTLAQARAVLDANAGTAGRELAIRRQLIMEAATTTFEDALGPHLAACDRALRKARTGLDG